MKSNEVSKLERTGPEKCVRKVSTYSEIEGYFRCGGLNRCEKTGSFAGRQSIRKCRCSDECRSEQGAEESREKMHFVAEFTMRE